MALARRAGEFFESVLFVLGTHAFPPPAFFFPCFRSPSYLSSGVMLTLGLGLNGLTLAGVSAVHLDISSSNAGFIFALGNTAATMAGLIAVPANGFILGQSESPQVGQELMDSLSI